MSSIVERARGLFGFRVGFEEEPVQDKIGQVLPKLRSEVLNTNKESALAIWAMGKTPLEEVEVRLREQFNFSSDKEIQGMIAKVDEIRKTKKF